MSQSKIREKDLMLWSRYFCPTQIPILKLIVLISSILLVVLLPRLATSQTQIVITDKRQEREIETCESEKLLFSFLSLAATFTNYRSVSRMAGGEKFWFETRDKIKLSGIKLVSEKPTDTYILIIQGNGFPAGRVIQEFEEFRNMGIDVYAFDFRGYKKSQGKRRFWAMLQDYTEILAHLNSKYKKRFIYATSFGGVIAANVISDYKLYDQVIFDSVVSRSSSVINCNRNYDPVDKLPGTCTSLLVQSNSDDRFYKNGYLTELMVTAEECGGQTVNLEGFEHPFEEDKEMISARMQRLKQLMESRQ